MKKIKSIKSVKKLKGVRVLLRLDLNVPLNGNEVKSDFRIKKSLPTIKFLKKNGAKVVIVSHIGRDKKASLKPVAQHMNKYVRVGFIPNVLGEDVYSKIENMKNGAVVLLENLRSFDGETENDKSFAKKLSTLADIYVNDAFSVSHRKNASITQVPKLLPSYQGLLFEEEVKNLSIALNPPRKSLLILGGAKMKTKIPLLNKYTQIVDSVFVGGALANTLLQERGYEIGKSVFSDGVRGVKQISQSKQIVLPADVFIENKKGVTVKKIADVEKEDVIVDVGPESIKDVTHIMRNKKLIIMNGPLGNYEKGFDKATVEVLKEMSKSGARTIIGGGDSTLLVSKLKLEKKFTFVSTGGGAMLEFLSKGTLPGIEALGK